MYSTKGECSMKEILKSKVIMLFIVFMLGISYIQGEQIKMDSSNENNLIIMNA